MVDKTMLIPFVLILMPVFLVTVSLVLKHRGRQREWRHQERMKALELGQPVPGTGNGSTWAAIAIGSVMPLGVFFCAWMASMTTRNSEEIWVAAAVVGVSGVIGGTKLAARGSQAKPAQVHGNGKPSFNPDAYDAIAHRG